ncbi:hypothetical protein [Schauerella aestuarii]|uniref:hypothetical protein n=1 Tax=Schauerella aestuarii TaxID=2511204 RepID=UPI00136D4C1B|nr:hypothetical protein [Achromobacter aestuarii]MYZ41751.1 hypothetical protein [Achromobacter aestuarii]
MLYRFTPTTLAATLALCAAAATAHAASTQAPPTQPAPVHGAPVHVAPVQVAASSPPATAARAAKPAAASLGVALPEGLDRATLIKLVAPNVDPARVTLVGAKPWPRRANSYVVLVCAAPGNTPASASPNCSQTIDPSNATMVSPTAYVGVVERAPDQAPALVAASGAIDTQAAWDDANLTLTPSSPDFARGVPLLPQQWDQFDLAAYKISDAQYAFGLRSGWSEPFAGGMATFSALYLFAIQGDRLAVILAEPMTAYRNMAADPGTSRRSEREVQDEENVLSMLNSKTAGYYDIRIKMKGDKHTKTRKWSAQQGRYVTAE